MAKPCRIDDTVCVQPHREIVGSIFFPRGCSSVLPKGCPSLRSSFEGPPEGLSDEGVHPRSWEVVNPSCGDLHQRSPPTLLPLRFESVRIRSNLVCCLHSDPGRARSTKIFVFCRVPLQSWGSSGKI